jgi:phosphopantetheinyl transferase
MRRAALPESWQSRALVLRDVHRPDRWFRADEMAVADAFKLPKRRNEWLLSRVAAKKLAMELGYAHDPLAITIDLTRMRAGGRELRVSLSHSGGYGAAAIDVQPVGIDIETPRVVRPQTAHFFLTDLEIAQMHRCRIDNALLHFWSAKEAAWKRLGGDVTTLKKVPLRLIREREDGVDFENVETFVSDAFVAALTR